MKIFGLVLLFNLLGSNAFAIAQDRKRTYYIQIGEWPELYSSRINQIVEKMIQIPEQCLGGEEYGHCVTFKRFTNDDVFKPWKRIATEYKYYIYYNESPDKVPRADLKFFTWDGKKMIRVGFSGLNILNQTDEQIQQGFVRRTFK